MTALLRKFLVLELNGDGAGFLVAANRVLDVEQTAVTGIAVGNQRAFRAAGNNADAADHVIIGCDACVRQPEI